MGYLSWRARRAEQRQAGPHAVPQEDLAPWLALWDRSKVIQRLFPNRLSFAITGAELNVASGDIEDYYSYLGRTYPQHKNKIEGAKRMDRALYPEDWDKDPTEYTTQKPNRAHVRRE